MWTGNNDSIGQNSLKNYMYNNKIFILDEITYANCAYLIGDITEFVFNEANRGKKLLFIINSPGGEVYTAMNIIGLMNLAKLYDIEIVTMIFGYAGSAASMIAIQGDKRFMSSQAKHFVHFGTIFDVTSKHSEIEKIYLQNKEYAENMISLYLEACRGKLSRDMLLKLQSDERGYVNAETCIKHGLADVIIENELAQKMFYDEKRDEFDKGFPSFIKQSKEKEKEKTKSTQKTKKKGAK